MTSFVRLRRGFERPGGAHPDRARLRRRLLAAVGALLAVSLVAPAAPAQQSQVGDPRVDARYEYGGLVRGFVPTVLSVTLSAQRPFAGVVRLVVHSMEGSQTAVERRVDVPAAGRKVVRFVVPGGGVQGIHIVPDGGAPMSRRAPEGAHVTEEVVGVLSERAPDLRRIDLAAVERQARLVPLPPELLDLGSGALTMLTHVVVDADLVASLSPRQRAALLAYAGDGGWLVVAGARDASFGFVPAPWRRTSAATINEVDAGAGRITLVRVGFGDTQWQSDSPLWRRAVRPTGSAIRAPAVFEGGGFDDGARFGMAPEFGPIETQGPTWVEPLGDLGGFRAPAIGWLLAFLIVYVLLAGPANFIALSMIGRRELAWITVPAISLLFGVGAYVVGTGLRSGQTTRAAAVVVADAGVERSDVGLAVLSRTGGTERLESPDGWTVLPVNQFSHLGITGRHGVRLERESATTTLTLPVGGVGVASFHRVRVTEAAGAGTLTFDGERFAGSPRNPFRFPLRQAVVVAPGVTPAALRVAHLDDLAPGARAEVDLAKDAEQPWGNALLNALRGLRRSEKEMVPASLFNLAVRRTGVGRPGTAFLLGTARLGDIGSPVEGRGDDGLAVVVAPLRVRAEPNVLLENGLIRREVVASGQQQGARGIVEAVPGGGVIEQRIAEPTNESIIRFTIPSGRRPVQLEIGIPRVAGGDVFPVPVPEPLPPNGEVRVRTRRLAPEADAAAPAAVDAVAVPEGASMRLDIAEAPQIGPGRRVAEVYDHSDGRWRRVPLDGKGVARFRGDVGSLRYVSLEGEILLRVRTDIGAWLDPATTWIREVR